MRRSTGALQVRFKIASPSHVTSRKRGLIQIVSSVTANVLCDQHVPCLRINYGGGMSRFCVSLSDSDRLKLTGYGPKLHWRKLRQLVLGLYL